MRTAALLVLLLGCAAGSVGCGPSGGYALTWRLAGETTTDAYSCSSHGVDAIMVQALRSDTGQPVDLAIFPCAPHTGERAIDSGSYVLQVTPLNVRSERIPDPRTGLPIPPIEVAVQVPADGIVDVGEVTVTPNPACADGVDNDGDGLVDLADPDCGSALGESEAPPPTD